VRGRIEQNLGILANIQGEHGEALLHYERALEACRRAGDERGCAYAYHNLGMVTADQKLWERAEEYFRKSLHLADVLHDLRLRGLCLLNHAEVHLALQHYEHARRSAEEALGIFNELDLQLAKADAYKMLGMIFRETGRPALAESRLRTAVELAVATGAVLSEAEATRELALLCQAMGRNRDALALLSTSHRLFGQLHARLDLVDVAAKVEELESTYLAVVRDWGQSIESADSYTHGHCERVATYALAVAGELRLDDMHQTTIRIGAYLHDLGKVRVPHEILNKAGRLTPAEFEVIKSHPVWGLELLAGIDLPWDIKPIIRSHHERYDGSGYPDGLKGDAIPLAAQIICVVDVFDALTTTRSYRPSMSKADALATMEDCCHWWRPDVYQAFLRAV
jgi:putative nucleotidyltransferase with HDIG domain